MTVTGKVVSVGEVKEFGAKGFKKRDFVIETDEKFPQKLLIEFQQDKTLLCGAYKPGQTVTIDINLRGREWKDPKTGEVKYFNSIVGWKIEATTGNVQQAVPLEASDDLPF